ncbi:MAG: UDP-3-O-(3-hydroxymyristoyl)glucosamine N-acyltransferase [Verrucomicrobiales bacterium]
MNISLAQLADLTGGSIARGSADLILTGFAGLADATPEDISFFYDDRYLAALVKTRAGALLVPEGIAPQAPAGSAVIEVAHPSLAFTAIVERFGAPPRSFEAGIHPSAVIAGDAEIPSPDQIGIGPCAVIESGAKIGAGTMIGAGAYIGAGARIGEGCLIDANATIQRGCLLGNRVIINSGAVIGSEGFGYETKAGVHTKVEQTGAVDIGDDVEIGAGSTIDRARFGFTRIGEGTKIDNLVQIGHNAVIGKHCIIVALTGIAGSARIGDHCTLAAQCGVAGHIEIGAHSVCVARTGVTKSLPGKDIYAGFPATTAKESRKLMVAPRRVPKIEAKLRALEERLRRLENAD